MAGRSSVLRGESIALTAVFLDAANQPTDATDIKLDIFPPGKSPDLGYGEEDAWVWEASLTSGGSGPQADPEVLIVHQSEGHYSYTLTIPEDADLGPAFDNWYGTVDSQDLDEVFSFVIVGGGSISEVAQLYNNNVVFVKLYSTVAATDETTLGSDYEFYFTTTYNPLYSSVRRIRLDLGALIANVPDDTINLAIFQASLEAEALTFPTQEYPTSGLTGYLAFAQKQYVTCVAELTLLNAIQNAGSSGGGMAKRLADLQVSYDGGQLDDLLKRAVACRIKWEAALTSHGEIAPGTSQRPSMVIKGIYDPDRPTVGREWQVSDDDMDSQYPAANTDVQGYYNRRWKKSFSRNRWDSRFSED